MASRGEAMQWVKASEGCDRLKESLREEHLLVLDFVSTVLKHVRGIATVPSMAGGSVCKWPASDANSAKGWGLLAKPHPCGTLYAKSCRSLCRGALDNIGV
jgi:hypothetical protein